MNQNTISPDDPRLTAYALGEMAAAERADFEPLLQKDAAARAAVEEIRSTAGLLGAALEGEPGPAGAVTGASVQAKAAIIPGGDLRRLDGGPLGDIYRGQRGPGRLWRFPQLYYVTAGLAAACFAVIFALRESQEQQPRPARKNAVRHEARENFAPAAAAPTAVTAMTDTAASSHLALVPAGASVEDRFFPTVEVATSTFPLHVGRTGYAEVRTQLQRGRRPARETVHVAEMINAFRYNYPEPQANEAFASVLEEAESPWSPGHRLVRIGLKGREDAVGVLARDARVEVEFNPARARAWRLIGFERAGDMIGVRGGPLGETMRAGDAVTALYEVVPAEAAAAGTGATLLKLSLHYTEPASGEARVFERTLQAGNGSFANASADFKFAAAVASFSWRLQDSQAQVPVAFDQVAQWAETGSQGELERREFVGLVRLTRELLHD